MFLVIALVLCGAVLAPLALRQVDGALACGGPQTGSGGGPSHCRSVLPLADRLDLGHAVAGGPQTGSGG